MLSGPSLHATPPASAPKLRPGRWEIVITHRTGGEPEQTRKAPLCIRSGQAIDPLQIVLAMDTCGVENLQTIGRRSTWKLSCVLDGNTLAGSGRLTYSAARLSGTNVLDVSAAQDGTRILTMHVNGSRVGECEP